MNKQVLKSKNILSLIVLGILAVLVFSPRIYAATGAAICFNPQTSLAYYCGSSAPTATNDTSAGNAQLELDSNHATQTLVVEKDKDGTYQPVTPVTSTKSADFGLYVFNNGECYIYEPVPNGPNLGSYAWVGNQDCTGGAYQTPVAQPMSTQVAGNSPSSVQNCSATGSTNCNLISAYINPLISFLNIAVILVVVISIAISGVQYSTSQDNPEAVKSARKRIVNALIGLVAYFLLGAFIGFIIPG
jgi:hypothetical protein